MGKLNEVEQFRKDVRDYLLVEEGTRQEFLKTKSGKFLKNILKFKDLPKQAQDRLMLQLVSKKTTKLNNNLYYVNKNIKLDYAGYKMENELDGIRLVCAAGTTFYYCPINGKDTWVGESVDGELVYMDDEFENKNNDKSKLENVNYFLPTKSNLDMIRNSVENIMKMPGFGV